MDIKEEKRSSLRLDVDSKLQCKTAGISEFHVISHINLSYSGIAFVCKRNFQIGEEAEIYITPETQVIPQLQFFIKIVRSGHRPDGTFSIAATIDYKDENQHD